MFIVNGFFWILFLLKLSLLDVFITVCLGNRVNSIYS